MSTSRYSVLETLTLCTRILASLSVFLPSPMPTHPLTLLAVHTLLPSCCPNFACIFLLETPLWPSFACQSWRSRRQPYSGDGWETEPSGRRLQVGAKVVLSRHSESTVASLSSLSSLSGPWSRPSSARLVQWFSFPGVAKGILGIKPLGPNFWDPGHLIHHHLSRLVLHRRASSRLAQSHLASSSHLRTTRYVAGLLVPLV
ncbi:hypothetical protein B0J13DRAFT_307085 [Dactylonectria estremocensis]|uniref:Uncharacterized protein n=1 Tax=Dactylonectria estremocensis TaxID=1079267 RepID=A0A9P9F0I1_9HYPO|nr:hypothetical protein B0J13DRAFT_307085 [Dactylonectria estremocensis]